MSTLLDSGSQSHLNEVKDNSEGSEETTKTIKYFSSPCRRPQRGERRSSSAPERRLLSRSSSSSSGNSKINSARKSPEAECSGQNKQCKSSKSSAWKTSKFFSRTLSSGELLRSLKKLSLSSSSEETECKLSETKLFRSRASSRKKVNNEEISIRLETRCTTVSDCGNKKSIQKEGIVCKKEDLMNLISEATKRKPGSSPLSRRVPLRQTRSASYESPREFRSCKAPVQRSGSEECRPKSNLFSDEEDKNTPIEVKIDSKEETPPEIQDAKEEEKEDEQEQEEQNELSEQEDNDESLSTVQWDEGAYIDAVLIGDAIETFLKGSMGSYEKRVSFKKS
ncbi:uncharacterized protein [Centruroides vittatus]|uniref:uncharacterized protein isoform X1 n=1 Tax=Centruroides vittatus TaxID=120091 RepID=UPI00351086EC